jgi:ATP-dependent Clp protease ATP-binding subunit ClpC
MPRGALTEGREETMNDRPLTPRVRKVLRLAQREPRGLGHNYVGTEHIRLGLLDEGEGVAARILFDFDVDPERVRNALIRIVGRGDPPDRDEVLLTEIRDTLVRIAVALEGSKGSLADEHDDNGGGGGGGG